MTETIEVQWETSQEVDSVGFYLYRRNVDADGIFVPLTAIFNGQGAVGGTYSYVDEEIVVGTTYQYLLVERKADGTLVEYRAQIVTIISGSTNTLPNRLYLPFIADLFSAPTPTPTATSTADPT